MILFSPSCPWRRFVGVYHDVGVGAVRGWVNDICFGKKVGGNGGKRAGPLCEQAIIIR